MRSRLALTWFAIRSENRVHRHPSWQVETDAPSGLARNRRCDQIPFLGAGRGAGGVFAPTRLRVGVVAEETNKLASLSLNSLAPLAPATPPPPHLLPPHA